MTIPIGSLMFSVFNPDCYSQFVSPAGVVLTPPASNPTHCPYSGPEEGLLALDDGTIGITNFQNYREGTFDDQLTPLGTNAAADLYSIASNYTDAFYGVSNIGTFGVTPIKVQKFDRACVFGTSWSLGITRDANRYALGVAPDESVAYFAGMSSHTVTRRDLVGASSSSFATEAGRTIGRAGSIVVLRNGEVLIAWRSGSPVIKHYSAAGALLHTYTPPGNPEHITPGLDDTSFWVSYWTSVVEFQRIRISDGAVLDTFAGGDGSTGYQWDAPFGVVRVEMEPAPGTVGVAPCGQCCDDKEILLTYGFDDGAPLSDYFVETAVGGRTEIAHWLDSDVDECLNPRLSFAIGLVQEGVI